MHHEIRVNGYLDSHWSAWFGGLQGSCDDRAETTITGRVADQAALHGLPTKVPNPGLELLEARRTHPSCQLRWSNAMQQEPIPRREAATPRRRQLRVARRQQRRRPQSPIDRRSPSGRLLPS